MGYCEEKIKEACKIYGLDHEKAIYEKDIVFVPSDIKDLYVLFDDRGNTISVDRINSENLDDKWYEQFCFYYIANGDGDLNSGSNLFDYALARHSFREIAKLSSIYDKKCIRSRKKSKSDIDEAIFNDDFMNYMMGIKFLDEEIKNYHLLSYNLQRMGFNTPYVRDYIYGILKQMHTYICNCVEEEKKPVPLEFMNIIGQSNSSIDSELLHGVFNILLKEKGYKAVEESNRIIKLTQNEKLDLDDLLNKIETLDNMKGLLN